MTRFAYTTLLAIAAFLAIGFLLTGWIQMLAFSILWTIYLTLFGCGVAFIRMNYFGRAICRGRPGPMKVALTFDDGPDPAATPALLDLLQRENIPATFFCIGKQVVAHPDIAARIVAEGHLIANHTHNHFWWTPLLGNRAMTHEIALAQQQIRESTGVTPRYMRPPIGLTNPHYPGVLRRAGLTMIGWDIRSLDLCRPPGEVIDRILRKARAGSIILLHDAGGKSPQRIIAIVQTVISGLRSRGFDFERVDGLVR